MTPVSVSAPVISSIVITPAGTIPAGTLITATVTYAPGTSQAPVTQMLTGTVTDSTTGLTGEFTQTFTTAGSVVTDPTAVTVADSGSRAWTRVSDTGTVAVYTSTA